MGLSTELIQDWFVTTWKTLDPASIDLPWEQVMSSNKRNIHLGEQPILMLSISGEKTKQNAERGIFLPYTLRSHGLGKNIHSLTEQALKQSRNLSPKFTFSCRQSMGQQLPPALETEGYGDILCSGQRSEVTDSSALKGEHLNSGSQKMFRKSRMVLQT